MLWIMPQSSTSSQSECLFWPTKTQRIFKKSTEYLKFKWMEPEIVWHHCLKMAQTINVKLYSSRSIVPPGFVVPEVWISFVDSLINNRFTVAALVAFSLAYRYSNHDSFIRRWTNYDLMGSLMSKTCVWFQKGPINYFHNPQDDKYISLVSFNQQSKRYSGYI